MAEQESDREWIEAVTEALARGQKIEAIKIYREATGKGLKEAKDFIDELIPQLVEKDAQRFAKLAQSSGCGAAVLAILFAVGSLVWLTTS